MGDKRKFDKEIRHSEKRANWGCLARIALLISILIFVPVLYIIYTIEIKETTLNISDSPNGINTIKVVEKGESMGFGPAFVRIKYGGEYKDTIVGNDGAPLAPSNVSVSWEDDDNASVSLYGDEQIPEILTIRFE